MRRVRVGKSKTSEKGIEMSNETQTPQQPESAQPVAATPAKKPIYKRVWFWVIVVVIVICIAAGAGSGSKGTSSNSSDTSTTQSSTQTSDTASQDQGSKEADVPTEYKSALTKAKSYSDTMHMSKQGIYDQLTSEYGEKFSAEAAQYAIDNVKADWNANALAKAKTYQDQMSMSPSAIHDQLTSEYGEKFTKEEADYAIANL